VIREEILERGGAEDAEGDWVWSSCRKVALGNAKEDGLGAPKAGRFSGGRCTPKCTVIRKGGGRRVAEKEEGI
jgi:hypothetical protein